MDKKLAKIIDVNNKIIESNPEFLFLFQKAILLSLKEDKVINDFQYSICIDKLTDELKKCQCKQLYEII